ncbi:Lysine-specific demethylase JMJ30 [Cladobotryum mycophilum]|uniref:Lysine-specific demethylase JMJ30 n=1 Tax=Cladobotryum mycophilum TaxID=491253 RepID=A0ABR0T2V8_9HYPO
MALGDDIILRYLEAARVLAASSIPQSPASISKENSTESSDSECDDLSTRGMATQQLLQRQASSMVRLHETWLVGGGKDSRVDGELLHTRLDDLASISMSAFYSYRFDLLPSYWRQIYTDTLILKSHYAILQASPGEPFGEGTLDLVVESLDRALITAGGAGKLLGKSWIEGTLDMLERLWGEANGERPLKQIKMGGPLFLTGEPYGRPPLSRSHECPRYQNWNMGKFEAYMNEGNGDPLPIVFTDLIREWPALTDRPWNNPDYLLSKTFGGRRLVPIEVGRSYVDEGWGQELVQFKHFLNRYVDPSIAEEHNNNDAQPSKTGYLAQHNLFQQIPSLRNDIQVPDFCWTDVPGHPTESSRNQPTVDVPQLNAWFGPARTITPLHTDGYHNLLCQVVGTKYVRLYPPRATPRLRPRGLEHGVDMSNTSELDIGVMEGWDPEPCANTDEDGNEESLSSIKESLKGVEYWECILGPGDTLVIPIGWWHYVRSLSISFSVSFWWN